MYPYFRMGSLYFRTVWNSTSKAVQYYSWVTPQPLPVQVVSSIMFVESQLVSSESSVGEQFSKVYGVNRLSILDQVLHFDLCQCLPQHDACHIGGKPRPQAPPPEERPGTHHFCCTGRSCSRWSCNKPCTKRDE